MRDVAGHDCTGPARDYQEHSSCGRLWLSYTVYCGAWQGHILVKYSPRRRCCPKITTQESFRQCLRGMVSHADMLLITPKIILTSVSRHAVARLRQANSGRICCSRRAAFVSGSRRQRCRVCWHVGMQPSLNLAIAAHAKQATLVAPRHKADAVESIM
jgi:hypothetical protein